MKHARSILLALIPALASCSVGGGGLNAPPSVVSTTASAAPGAPAATSSIAVAIKIPGKGATPKGGARRPQFVSPSLSFRSWPSFSEVGTARAT